MRISDWSSDVCSSDLSTPCATTPYFTSSALQPPVAALASRSAPARSVLQPLTVCTRNTEPLKVFSWKLLNCWRNAATLTEKARVEYLAPTSKIGRASCRDRVCQYV